MQRRRAVVVRVAVAAAVALGAVPAAAATSSDQRAPSTLVPPAAFGPDLGTTGVKLRKPHLSSSVPLARHGYVETEHIVSGTARLLDGSSPKRYRTRVVVRRPSDPGRFSGTVLQEWFNVSLARDVDVVWVDTFAELLRSGHAYVGVSAQPSAVPLRAFDPVRYADVDHPGSEYAEDIMQQVAVALRALPQARNPLGAAAAAVLATGQSQSAERLHDYLKDDHERYRVFDGFLIDRGIDDRGSIPFVADPSVPTVFTLGEFESDPDHGRAGRNARVWQIAGGAHVSGWLASYSTRNNVRDVSGVEPAPWNPELQGEWGESGDGNGLCGITPPTAANRFPDRYARSAALHHLERWVRTGTPAPQPPLMEFDGTAIRRDADGNAVGGVRLPQIDVPVATYDGETCPALQGSTQSFSDAQLLDRYPAFGDYRTRMQQATGRSVAAGVLRPCDAVDVMLRVDRAAGRWPVEARSTDGGAHPFRCDTSTRGTGRS